MTRFPRTKLLIAPAVPVGILLFGLLAERTGHHWGSIGAALFTRSLAVAIAAGTCVTLVTLASVLPALKKERGLRTGANIACTAIGAVFAIGGSLIVCSVVHQTGVRRILERFFDV